MLKLKPKSVRLQGLRYALLRALIPKTDPLSSASTTSIHFIEQRPTGMVSETSIATGPALGWDGLCDSPTHVLEVKNCP